MAKVRSKIDTHVAPAEPEVWTKAKDRTLRRMIAAIKPASKQANISSEEADIIVREYLRSIGKLVA